MAKLTGGVETFLAGIKLGMTLVHANPDGMYAFVERFLEQSNPGEVEHKLRMVKGAASGGRMLLEMEALAEQVLVTMVNLATGENRGG